MGYDKTRRVEVPNFVWYSPNLKFCSQFHHRICSLRLELSTGSALEIRQNQATNTPFGRSCQVSPPPTWPQWWRDTSKTFERRCRYGPRIWSRRQNEPPSAHGRHPQVFDAERPPQCRAKAFHGGITQKPSVDGPSQAVAEPADGGQRATHPRHGRGKGTA